MIKGEISMNFQGDKKEYQELAVSKEFQHMIANIMKVCILALLCHLCNAAKSIMSNK